MLVAAMILRKRSVVAIAVIQTGVEDGADVRRCGELRDLFPCYRKHYSDPE